MIPLRDENPSLHPPIGVFLLIGLNILCWAFLQGFGAEQPLLRSICQFGLIPAELLGSVPAGTPLPLSGSTLCTTGGWALFTPVSSMFLHGGWFHLLGNLWFLWVFGDNVEDLMGTARFLLFYLLCGLAAAFAQILSGPESLLPMVGASGAIGGVMGAYARFFPRVPVHTLVVLIFFWTTVSLPAFVLLAYWFLLQILGGLPALAGAARGGVAFWAHIGGFAAGWLLINFFCDPQRLAEIRRALPRSTARFRLDRRSPWR